MLPILSKYNKNFPSPKIECNYASNSSQKTQWALKKADFTILLLQLGPLQIWRARVGFKKKSHGLPQKSPTRQEKNEPTYCHRFSEISFSILQFFIHSYNILNVMELGEKFVFLTNLFPFPYFSCSSSELPEFTVQTTTARIFLISIGIFPSFSSFFLAPFFVYKESKGSKASNFQPMFHLYTP